MWKRVVETIRDNFMYQLFFLGENGEEDVEVVESSQLDFLDIERRLDEGESIFITRRLKREFDLEFLTEKTEEQNMGCKVYGNLPLDADLNLSSQNQHD